MKHPLVVGKVWDTFFQFVFAICTILDGTQSEMAYSNPHSYSDCQFFIFIEDIYNLFNTDKKLSSPCLNSKDRNTSGDISGNIYQYHSSIK
jgi:hypothetical protein